MNIAIIAPSNLPLPAVYGGAVETLIQNFIEINEVKNKLKIIIFSSYNDDALKKTKGFCQTDFIYLKKGIQYSFINFFFRFARKILGERVSYLDIIQIVKKIRSLDVDLILVEGNSYHLMELSKYFSPEKLVFHIHAKIINEKSHHNSKIIVSAHKIIVVSQYIKKEIIRFTNCNPSSIYVLPNGIDVTKFNNIETLDKKNILKQYNIETGIPIILFVGRIVENKGILQLIKALINIRNSCRFHLMVVGSLGSSFGAGEDESEFSIRLKELVKENHQWISLTGFVHNSDLPAIYAVSNIVVVPSLCDEAAPLVPLEAMAAAKALIVTNAGGIPEYVTNDCAIIIKKDQEIIPDLSEALKSLINNKDKREAMGRKGSQVVQKYSHDNYYTHFLNILKIDNKKNGNL